MLEQRNRNVVLIKTVEQGLALLNAYIGFIEIAQPKIPLSIAIAEQLIKDLDTLDRRKKLNITNRLREMFVDGYIASEGLVEYKGFSYNPVYRVVTTPYLEHPEAELTPIEGGLFSLMLSNPERFILENRLVDVWFDLGGSQGDVSLLKTHISHIRTKIGDKKICLGGIFLDI